MKLHGEFFLVIAISNYICEGKSVNINDYPWLVSIQFDFFGQVKHACGGVIISDVFVLTTASCFDGALSLFSLFSVHAGIDNIFHPSNTNEQIRRVSEITLHPNYTSETFHNDLSLVRISSAFDFKSLSTSIVSLSNTISFENMDLITIGWNRVVDLANQNASMILLRGTIVRESVQCSVNPSFDRTTQICAIGMS